MEALKVYRAQALVWQPGGKQVASRRGKSDDVTKFLSCLTLWCCLKMHRLCYLFRQNILPKPITLWYGDSAMHAVWCQPARTLPSKALPTLALAFSTPCPLSSPTHYAFSFSSGLSCCHFSSEGRHWPCSQSAILVHAHFSFWAVCNSKGTCGVYGLKIHTDLHAKTTCLKLKGLYLAYSLVLTLIQNYIYYKVLLRLW